jgi:hypothetical protein
MTKRTNKKRNYNNKKQSGIRLDINGWVYISVEGAPKERGAAYGRLIREDMKEVQRIVRFLIENDFGVSWDFFIRAAHKYYVPTIQSHFPEFYEEMAGFASGAAMDVNEVVAWNLFFTLTEGWWANMPEEESMEVYGRQRNGAAAASREGGGSAERCTAFIAVGDWTADGKIVCAHNNFSNFLDGQLAKYVVDMKPAGGNRILMNGFPGWIWSGTDFFVTSAGIIGTETTIGGFTAYENNIPICCRIRNAMQYGNTLDDYERMLLDGNSGDYANSWLFGDVNKNEIMRLELGLRFHRTERTKNGFYIGFNAPYDARIRNLECVNTGIDDLRRHQGARKARLNDLMDQWKGKLDIEVAKSLLADHYDPYLKKENPCSRTCCAHYELDAREFMSDASRPKPFQPRGAVDGNVIDSHLAQQMSFVLRWGNSCGMPFDKRAFCTENRVWDYLEPYLHDRPTQPWTLLRSNMSQNNAKKNKQIRTKTKKTRKKSAL